MKSFMEKRLAGILQPVCAIRTRDDLGTGDTDGVSQMMNWCHRHGIRVFQMLPINETGGDHCPYNAISALAIHPVTLAISPGHINLLLGLRQGAVLCSTLFQGI
jgi:4-alpha-glucanotransferase